MKVKCLGIVAICLVRAAAADVEYQTTSLPLPAGATGMSPSAVNQEHQIGLNVAFPACDGGTSTFTLPYLWSGGLMTALPMGNGFVSGSVLGLNDSGNAVGFVTDPAGGNFPALWAGGALTLLDHGGMPEGVAASINSQGQVAGAISTHGGMNYASHAALWNGTALVDLSNYATTQASAVSLNNNGQVLVSANSGNSTFFIHQQGMDRALGPSITAATAINDLGQVVVGDSNNVNYLWQDGRLTALPSTAGDLFDVPWAMNDAGDVVGYAETGDFQNRAILLGAPPKVQPKWQSSRSNEVD